MKKLFAPLLRKIVMFMENVRMSIANIMSNRMRSFLTILGIMIGVTAVIALITTISGVSASISSSFTSMGAGQLTVSIQGSDIKTGLNAENLEEIADVDHVTGITPNASLSVSFVRGGERETGVSVSGKNGYYFEKEEDIVSSGRAVNVLDVERKRLVPPYAARFQHRSFCEKLHDPSAGSRVHHSGQPRAVRKRKMDGTHRMSPLLHH